MMMRIGSRGLVVTALALLAGCKGGLADDGDETSEALVSSSAALATESEGQALGALAFPGATTPASGVATTLPTAEERAAALKAYQQIEWQNQAPIKMEERSLELGVRKPGAEEVAQAKKLLTTAKRLADGSYYLQPDVYANETVAMWDYPATVNAKLQAIRIGGLGITSIPCEVFVEIGLELKRKSPLKSLFTIELANGYNGYLPTAEHHKLGGYETWRARSAYLAEDSAAKITTTLLQMLGNVANR